MMARLSMGSARSAMNCNGPWGSPPMRWRTSLIAIRNDRSLAHGALHAGKQSEELGVGADHRAERLAQFIATAVEILLRTCDLGFDCMLKLARLSQCGSGTGMRSQPRRA